MAPPLAKSEPLAAIVGDTWEWTRSFTDYPVSEGWVLSYGFAPLTAIDQSSITQAVDQSPITWSPGWVTNDGRQYTVSIPAATTAVLLAGGYAWQAFLALAGKRHTVASGTIAVTSNLADPTTEVEHAVEMLKAVRAELKARLDGTGSGYESYQIGPRAVGAIPFKELRDYESALAAKVGRLTHPGSFGRDIHQRYRRASSC